MLGSCMQKSYRPTKNYLYMWTLEGNAYVTSGDNNNLFRQVCNSTQTNKFHSSKGGLSRAPMWSFHVYES